VIGLSVRNLLRLPLERLRLTMVTRSGLKYEKERNLQRKMEREVLLVLNLMVVLTLTFPV
jgi:hypothetical protein